MAGISYHSSEAQVQARAPKRVRTPQRDLHGGGQVELLTEPPPAEAIAKMTAIEGVRIVPVTHHAARARAPSRTRRRGCRADPACDVR